MPVRINVPCNGSNGGTHSIDKVPDKITFGTSGNCTYVSFRFAPVDPAPGFSNRSPTSGGGATISYDYNGSQIPTAGYTFEYVTDSMKMLGNGTGVIKNT